MNKRKKNPKVTIIGVPTNSSGKIDGVARGPSALRRAGLIDALASHCDVHDYGDVLFSQPILQRSTESGIIAERSLISMIYAVRRAVNNILADVSFPLVIGGDCPILLGCLAAARDIHKRIALLFVDGHEDAYATYQSPTGEAADMELGFALGLEKSLPQEINRLVPMIGLDNVALLGPRDKQILQDMSVSSLSKVVEFYDDIKLHGENVENLTRSVLSRLQRNTNGWWLHVDLDVLSSDSLPAVDYPQIGGLNWEKLEKITTTALRMNHNLGWNVTIYNPDLDPDSKYAKRIVQYLASAISSLNG
jgi:arginase